MPDTITTEFLALRDRYIASCFTKLNPVQQQAVFTTEGPLLILAGAGSGKTTVLDCRLGAHIAPDGFSPWNDRTDTGLASFAEEGSSGAGAAPRPAWVNEPSAADAAALLARARKRCRPEV